MSEPNANHYVLPLIEALLNGEIDDAGFTRLEAILRDDADARRLYRSYANLHASLPGTVGRSPRLSISITDTEDDTLLEPHEMSHGQLMSLLSQVEDQGEDLDPMTLVAERFQPPAGRKSAAKNQYKDALSYVIRHTFTPKRVAIFATAAALLLGMVLTIVLMGGPEQVQEVAETPDTKKPANDVIVVATLTKTYDAVWADVPGMALPQKGKGLYAGQRLMLSEGFAEITTKRGSVAILEAPCTVEMLESENAIELIEGKLVGLCHTPESKGFVVKTDQAKVTDLGTEFGVEVTDRRVTATVFSGEVQFDALGVESTRLVRRQTALLSYNGGSNELRIEDRIAEGFTQRMPRPALVTDARINIEGFEVRVIPRAVREDAKLFTDRDHEINGLDADGIPKALRGGDLIMMPTDACTHITKDAQGLRLEIGLAQAADVYLLLSEEEETLDWLIRDFEMTEMRVGIDLAPFLRTGRDYATGVGPGVSIDRSARIWKYKGLAEGRITVSGNTDMAMYSIIVVPKGAAQE